MEKIVVGRDPSDMITYGDIGTLFIGKHIVGKGEDAHLTTKVLLDAIRPHVITICGKRGSGKCLHGDTLITLEDGSQIPIKELENNAGKILALNKNLKIEKSEREGFFVREVDKLLKIKLRSGKEIKLTPEHPLLTIKGWQPAQELKLGCRIATPRKIPVAGSNELPEHEVNLLAYLIAEGHTKKATMFSNNDPLIVKEFEKSLKAFDNNLELIKERKGCYRISCPTWKTEIINKSGMKTNKKTGQFEKGSKAIYKKRSIRKLMEKHGLYGKGAKEKTLSSDLMTMKESLLALFLNRLFSCDGSIYKINDYWEMSYASSSEILIRQVQSLLLRFEIVSRLRRKTVKCNGKKFRSYELVINASNTIKFIKKIGFFGDKTEKQIVALKEINSKIRNPNIDTIPKEIWHYYKPKNWSKIGRFAGYKHPKAMRERIKYSPARSTLLMISESEENEFLRMVALSDIFWDEIVSIEILEGTFKVYDITVPVNHNFVANDIIVHNSFSLGVFVEELFKLEEDLRERLCSVLIDTQGIFWTMKNSDEENLALLKEWKLEPRGFNTSVYVPAGQKKIFEESGVDFDDIFSFSPSELTAEDWLNVFGIDAISGEGIILEKVISRMKTKENYNLQDIIDSIEKERGFEKEKLALENMFIAAQGWGIFSEGTKAPEILVGGKISILDVSLTPQSVRSLLVALISRKILAERIKARRQEELVKIELIEKNKTPMCWILIDEAHNFAPAQGTVASSEIMGRLVKEGRQPGISTVFATQRPEKLHPDILAQSDIVLSHRLTSKADIDALRAIMQTYMMWDITKYLNELPRLKGTAIVLDDSTERPYKIRIRPRQSWHAGASPTAI